MPMPVLAAASGGSSSWRSRRTTLGSGQCLVQGFKKPAASRVVSTRRGRGGPK